MLGVGVGFVCLLVRVLTWKGLVWFECERFCVCELNMAWCCWCSLRYCPQLAVRETKHTCVVIATRGSHEMECITGMSRGRLFDIPTNSDVVGCVVVNSDPMNHM